MAKFSMNDLLNSQSRKAPERVQSEFEIRHIPIGKIIPAENNKYGIRDIEELAASIETMGLLHNLVVKEPNAEGFYELVSGERRFRACKMLYEGGNEKFSTVPCKVEGNEDKAFTELKLIYANATSRELTDYEKTYQAGRIKELLQELKANGYKFKGRMREIVADILNVSPAQMWRMESINKNLSPEFTEEFKGGNIGITTAYELSTLPKEKQATAMEEYKAAGAEAVKDVKKRVQNNTVKTSAPPPSSKPPKTSAEQPRQDAEGAKQPKQKIDRIETIRLLRAIAHDIESGNDGSSFDIYGVCMDAASLLEGKV
ncbi:ParB/RepB/Spo0J family partition protein [Caproiciproducens galactitolivorans]|uniref:ParB/RepB/Spo0J family partition protein n=1 Tax=Caproiciproducens galactitolivorans TaxID=642589 RepID=UPI00240A5D81|nr:ParB/RepB/Spo0J family partition protein [Caproiciproducens galactitolivorans]